MSLEEDTAAVCVPRGWCVELVRIVTQSQDVFDWRVFGPDEFNDLSLEWVNMTQAQRKAYATAHRALAYAIETGNRPTHEEPCHAVCSEETGEWSIVPQPAGMYGNASERVEWVRTEIAKLPVVHNGQPVTIHQAIIHMDGQPYSHARDEYEEVVTREDYDRLLSAYQVATMSDKAKRIDNLVQGVRSALNTLSETIQEDDMIASVDATDASEKE